LGKKCTPEEAREYVNEILRLGNKRILARQYTEVLLKKADRFLNKKSFKKAKQ